MVDHDSRPSREVAQGRQPSGADPLVYVGGYLSMHTTTDGWEYVQHNHASNVVAVLGVVDDTFALLVRQYRPPVLRYVLELPAGLAESDDFAREARREFAEETGRDLEGLTALYVAPVCSGLTSTWLRVYGGSVSPVQDGNPSTGLLKTVLVPLAALAGHERCSVLAHESVEQTVYAAAFRFLSGRRAPGQGAR
jgi:8-oxo-dGTP pyrophosphatase MutT (NUDIX family)